MSRLARNGVLAAALSLLVPGAGHAYLGARRRARVLLAASAALVLVVVAVAAAAEDIVAGAAGPELLVLVLAANAALLALRVYAIADAGRTAASGVAAVALAAILVLAAAPHAAAAYFAIRGYAVVDAVFADEEPPQVLSATALLVAQPAAPPRDLDPPAQRPLRSLPGPAPQPFRGVARPLADTSRVLEQEESALVPPWVTILLLGSDEGPGQAGDRTDTMIAVAVQRDTGRAVMFGIPRNVVGVPLGGGARFSEPLNALYQRAHARPGLFPGGEDPGATALKRAITQLLGLRIDYYALVNLDGFVDALGGVRIRVRERIVDEVTRPSWGETKPRIDVYPGRTYLFTGRKALAYVRSRKASSDYRRMARQRCFLSALANQLDVTAVLRNFAPIARAVEESARTDIPLDRAPDLLALAVGIDTNETLTETFGPAYFAGRRASDGYPYPDVAKIRATVRDAILHPERARATRKLASAKASC